MGETVDSIMPEMSLEMELGLPPQMEHTAYQAWEHLDSSGMPVFSRTHNKGEMVHACESHGDNDTQIVHTRTAPRMAARTTTQHGVEAGDLEVAINQEIVDLKMFMKAEGKGKGKEDVDSQIKNFYRDKYRQKHASAQQQPGPAPQAVESAEDNNGRDLEKSFEKTYESAGAARHRGVYSPRHKVDSTLSRSVQEQVGAEDNVGWKNEIPDGWGSGYTYQYGRDSIPSAARGVPLPATFGGRGGGGKRSQRMAAQEDSGRTDYERRTGRAGAQASSEWVTWHQLPAGRDPRDIPTNKSFQLKSGDSGRMGVAPWQHTQCSSSSGKKGRNVAVDSMQSMRGGSVDVASARVGQHEKVSAVQGWYSPSHHSSGYHDAEKQRQNPNMFLKSETGRSHLGGGKLGRNHLKEPRGDSESWLSAQARPQMGEYGTGTGGGARGRNQVRDAQQSSSSAPFIC